MFFVGTGGVFSGDITGCIRIVRFEVIKYAGVMALSASIFKATVRIDDMDRSHYGTYSLTLARHPSETDERMMVRLLAFMCYADERLSFTKGLSETDEPDLWMHDLQGQVALWIETGTPTLRRVVSACRKAERVVVFAYGRSVMQWWRKNGADFGKMGNLDVVCLPEALTDFMVARVHRTMQWQCLVQDGQMTVMDENDTFEWDLRGSIGLSVRKVVP